MTLRGDVPIILLEPGEIETDDFGEQVGQSWAEREVMARRSDRSASEIDGGGVPAAIQTTIWTVVSLGLEKISTAWRLRDFSGNIYLITAIQETPPPHAPRKFIDIHTELQNAG